MKISATIVKNSLPARAMLRNLPTQLKLSYMLRWSIIFFVIAIIAAIFGFGGIAEGAASIAKVLFFIFLALFIIAILFGATLFKK
jgi:uncharacterized membrane protein YtjA (UPF0391 family)